MEPERNFGPAEKLLRNVECQYDCFMCLCCWGNIVTVYFVKLVCVNLET
jgi:hypothetical protein